MSEPDTLPMKLRRYALWKHRPRHRKMMERAADELEQVQNLLTRAMGEETNLAEGADLIAQALALLDAEVPDEYP